MKTTKKLLIVSVILLTVMITGCVSAADNSTTTSDDTQTTTISDDISTTQAIQTTDTVKEKTVKSSSSENIKTKDNKNTTTKVENKEIKKDSQKTVESTTKTTKKGAKYDVRSSDYDLYFAFNETTNMTQTTNLVRAGDTINLLGEFKNVNFTIDKPGMTITSEGRNARLYNCSVLVMGINSSNSTVENLTINNSNFYGTGIHTNVTKNITIYNNKIHVNGPFAFALAADSMNNSYVYKNYFETSTREDTFRTHTAAAFGSCYYNLIKNNTVVSDYANGIYFSVYGSGKFLGGYCYDNNVTGNDVTGGDTSWSYTIQIMGTRNIIDNNRVRGGYRGISTQDFTNNTIINNDVNGTNEGIYACEGAIVLNNSVRVNGSTTGITVGGDGVLLEGNYISSNNGSCVVISANNVTIKDNTMWSTDSYCIYSKGKYTQINITGNDMRSKKAGILFRKQSTTKRINHVSVTKNRIQSYGDCAIDFTEAGALNPADVNITVADSNALNCSAGSGLEKAYLPPAAGSSENTSDSNKTYVVTEDTYYQYFNDDFSVNTRKVLKNDTIILQGTFTNKDFLFPIKVHVIGRNCIINEGTVRFSEDASASTVCNVTIINKGNKTYNRHGIELLEVNNCNVTNNTVYNYDLWESFGIWVYSSSGSRITKNIVVTSGDYVNHGILLYASDLSIVADNKVHLNQSAKPVQYADEIMYNEKMGTIGEVLHNYGILLLYSSYNTIENNNVTTKSLFKEYTFPTTDCKNSVVGIDVYYDSNYNLIQNNNINVDSLGPYAYGMGVLGAPWGSSITAINATNNTFTKNNVTVKGGYFATGFIAGLHSVYTLVEDNQFTVSAVHNSTQKGDYVYGLTLEAARNTTVRSNTFNTSGAAVYNVEIFDSNNNELIGNDFTSIGSYLYGVAGYRACDNKIISNNFSLKNAKYGDVAKAVHSDAIPYGNAGVLLMYDSFRNNVTLNTINSTAPYTVNLTVQAINNTVVENSLRSAKLIGDASVLNDHATNKVERNFLHFTTASMSPIKATVGQPFTINGVVSATTSDLSNITVQLKMGTTLLGTTKVAKDGKFSVKVNETSFFKPTSYTITAYVTGTNFQNATTTATLNLNRTLKDPTVTVTKVKALPGANVTFTVNVEGPLSDKPAGQIILKLDGKVLTTQNLTLGRITYKYKLPMNIQPGIHNITAVYSGDDKYSPAEGSNILGVLTTSVTTTDAKKGAIGDKINITAKVTSNGAAVKTGKATIIVNGMNVAKVDVVNGKLSYQYTIPTNFTTKVYNIKVKYEGNDTIAASTGNNNLTVVAKQSKINFNTTYATVGENTNLKISISDMSGKILAKGGSLTIKINGKQLKNPDGTPVTGKVDSKTNLVVFTFTAPSSLVGKNNVSFAYSGDNQFTSSEGTFTNALIINPKGTPTKIVVNNVTAKYGSNATFKATIYDNNGNLVTSGKVVFKLNGVTLKKGGQPIKADVVNGVAQLTYFVKNTAKDYKLTAVFSDNKVRLEKQVTFKVIRADKYLKLDGIITTGNSAKITGKIYDEFGNLVCGNTKVTVKINGKTVLSKVAVANGTMNINLDTKNYKDGVYNVTIIAGENNMQNMVSNNTLLMKNVKDAIVVMPQTAKRGTTITLTSYVFDKNANRMSTGDVVYKLNGKTIATKTTVQNGIATVQYTIPESYSAKDYTLTANYSNGSMKLTNSTVLCITK